MQYWIWEIKDDDGMNRSGDQEREEEVDSDPTSIWQHDATSDETEEAAAAPLGFPSQLVHVVRHEALAMELRWMDVGRRGREGFTRR